MSKAFLRKETSMASVLVDRVAMEIFFWWNHLKSVVAKGISEADCQVPTNRFRSE